MRPIVGVRGYWVMSKIGHPARPKRLLRSQVRHAPLAAPNGGGGGRWGGYLDLAMHHPKLVQVMHDLHHRAEVICVPPLVVRHWPQLSSHLNTMEKPWARENGRKGGAATRWHGERIGSYGEFKDVGGWETEHHLQPSSH